MTTVAAAAPPCLPLCVDLDGTLVRSDMLLEGLLAMLSRPLLAGRVLLAARSGRAAVKRAVAASVAFDPALLPLHQGLLAYLRAQRARGRRLILVTAADQAVAERVAAHVGLFDEVIASDGVTNLKGLHKAARLSERFGRGGFAYAGDSRADLAVWAQAGAAVLVETTPAVATAAGRLCPVEATFNDRRPAALALLRAVRPHQWAKNLLVFVPLFVSGAPIGTRLGGAALAFLAFCATASSIYLTNDLMDLAADRGHPRKSRRPIASGELAAAVAAAAAGALLAVGLVLGVVAGVLGLLLLYAASSTAYSLWLKRLVLVDVFMLAGLYTLRLAGGGEAAGAHVSLWLLAFSSFLFLSLALVKRVGELAGPGRSGRRGYVEGDAAVLQVLGCGCAIAASVVLALFVQNEATAERYASPALLWCVVPLMLFWTFRIWLSTARGYMHDDPIVYAARDRVSWVVALLVAGVMLAARGGGGPG